MLRLAIVLCLSALAFGHVLETKEWNLYKKAFNKQHSLSEEKVRKANYLKNVEGINEHNIRFEKKYVSYSLGVNQFTDMDQTEVEMLMNGFKNSNSTTLGSAYLFNRNETLADTVDWRKKGFVTPVKNQVLCGCCWAFSTTGSLEGQHKKKTGKLVSLSEQNLVDCSTAEGNEGCNGGSIDYAFEYIKENHGIDTEKSYPYESQNGDCRFKKSNVGATVTGYVDIPTGDEDALKHAVATVGPISVAIDSGHPEFVSYRSGILDIEDCSSTRLDHGVLAVGYGTHNGKDYWLVKNSWGESWGMKGYAMMSRNKNNQCGIASKSSYPLV